MNLLEYYQNHLPSSEYFVPRKSYVPSEGDINVFGVRGSGKTSLVLDMLSQIKKEHLLYIDLDDPNLLFETITPLSLQQYIDKHDIYVSA